MGVEGSESPFAQVRTRLRSARELRMQLVSETSPAAGLHALAEREAAALIVIGSSHRSRIDRILVGGTGERLLSGAPAPVAVAPAGYAAAASAMRRRRGEELAGAVSALGSDIDADQRLLDGDAELLLASESSELDLLVVGSSGYGPLRAVLLGSVSSALVRSAQSPLVVVPRGADDESVRQGTTSPRRIA